MDDKTVRIKKDKSGRFIFHLDGVPMFETSSADEVERFIRMFKAMGVNCWLELPPEDQPLFDVSDW